MEPWSITLSATLDRPVPQHMAFALGQHSARDRLLSVAVHDERFGIIVTSPIADPVEALADAQTGFVEALAGGGYTVTAWDAVEALSYGEVERRLSAASIPPMVSAVEFAELCGVSKQWIYDLESKRAAAAKAGESLPFPTPIVPGWWIKAAAERFAATRKRKPGPAPRRENPLLAPKNYPKPIDPQA